MDLRDAVEIAKLHIGDLFAADILQNVRLESFLYDDHLMVWSLTIGFALSRGRGEGLPAPAPTRNYKIVRVSEADKAVLSVRDP